MSCLQFGNAYPVNMVVIIEELLKALPENRLLTESRFDYEKWSFAITFTEWNCSFQWFAFDFNALYYRVS